MVKKKVKKNVQHSKKKTKKQSKAGIFIALTIIAIITLLLIWKFGNAVDEKQLTAYVYLNNEMIFLNEVTDEINNLPKDTQSELMEKNNDVNYKKQLLTDISNANTNAKKEIDDISETYDIDFEEVANSLVIKYSKENIDKGAIIVVVNGDSIYELDLVNEFNRLPAELQLALDQNSVLSQLIDKQLLLAEAKKAETNIEDDVEAILEENSITIEDLEANVAAQGYTLEEFKEQLMIFAFLDENIFFDLKVGDIEAKKYYDENLEQFTLPESVLTRHILVSTDELSDEEAMARMDEVKALFDEDNEKFCDLVTEYSEDPGSLENCGEYPALLETPISSKNIKKRLSAMQLKKQA